MLSDLFSIALLSLDQTMFRDSLLLEWFHLRIVSIKFKRVRNRRDLRNNPAHLSLIIDEESAALGGVVFNVTQKSGQIWASCPGRPPDPWSVLFSSLCPSSSSDAVTYVFFSPQAAGVNSLCTLAGGMGTGLHGLISRTSGNLPLFLPGQSLLPQSVP